MTHADTTSQSELRLADREEREPCVRLVLSPDRPNIGRAWLLGDGHVLGRDPACEMAVDDRRMSRHHVAFGTSGAGLPAIRDLGSKNGLRVNGAPTTTRLLRLGDVLRVGDSLMVVDSWEPEPPLVPAGLVAVGSRSLAALRETLRAAPTDLSVLLSGPSGSGKEVYSEALHRASGRRGPFHAVNCGAIPRELIEASLFGHRKGAFTGATAPHEGHIREARGGTLLLDEVAELLPPAQVALLRVLETREVTPVGGTRGEPVDVRIVAATHQDLRAAVAAGSFRDDLFARLAEWTITVPALGERRADIPDLIAAISGPEVTFHVDAVEALMIAEWPHNVRGLRAAVRQAMVRAAPASSPGGALQSPVALAHLPEALAGLLADNSPPTVGVPWGRPSRDELQTTLRHYGGRIHLVARHYGKDRRQIYRWLDYAGLADSRR